jgi:transcriptional regulator with XRE-family HTH domain
MKTPPTFRESILTRLASLGMSQAELARRCEGKPSQPRISRYLAGKVDMSGAHIQRMADALGLELKPCKR